MQRYFDINENGHSIRCKLYAGDIKDIRFAVVFCHGFGGHKDNSAAARFAEWMINKKKGASLITFDLPCHGDDVKKKLILSDCSEYISLVIKNVKEKFSVTDIYSYATSFGGYLTLKYISEHANPFKKIALRCPAVKMCDTLKGVIVGKDSLEKLEKGKEALVGFDRKVAVTRNFLDELSENDITKRDFLDFAEDIIIIHGTADEVVPYDSSFEFADTNLIEFVSVQGADHRFHDPQKMDIAIKSIFDFFAF